MNVNFLIDENDVLSVIDELSHSRLAFEKLLEILQNTHEFDARVLYEKKFYSRKFENGECLADRVYSGNHDTRDDFLKFTRLIDKGTYIEDCYDIVSEEVVSDEDALGTYANSLNSVGVITRTDFSESAWWDFNKMMLIDAPERPMFFLRTFFMIEDVSEDIFWAYCCSAFPDLYFHDALCLKDFDIKDIELFPWLINCLAYLNDEALSDWKSHGDDFTRVAGTKGVEMSPESPNTRRQRAKMKLREIEISGVTVCCELHAKYQYNQGRVHFHIGQGLGNEILAKTNKKIIVGIFCKHLTI